MGDLESVDTMYTFEWHSMDVQTREKCLCL